MANEQQSREERLKLIGIAINRATSESCPYCQDLDIGYHGWAQRSQLLKVEVSEQHFGEAEGTRDRDYHPDFPLDEQDKYLALICMNCGFTKLFRVPPF